MIERLFTETFFKKNDYFESKLNISKNDLKTIKNSIENWKKICENFNPDLDKFNHFLSNPDVGQKDSFTEEILSSQAGAEEQVKKAFYLEYKTLRTEIFYQLLEMNPLYKTNKSRLLELVQKLLDRIIFCWFCEDSRAGLLPINVLSKEIIGAELQSKYYSDNDYDIYSKVQKLFNAIDVGGNFNIAEGYNGELFKEDNELGSLKIPNFLFKKISEIGLKYDFGDENELNVNILGHIFEQSISDLEEMRVQFQEYSQGAVTTSPQTPLLIASLGEDLEVLEHKHQKFDPKKTKRKKEGVYYTPDYITKYIVENTVGEWLKEKWQETTKEFSNLKKNKEYTILQHYRDEHLSKIKILDPACGSGAFLVAAFNYLWKEHERIYKQIKEIKSKTAQGELFDFDLINKTILENNLYGVDLNRESVEITKLSLWLKTAVRNKKLNNLENNIKVGNSLIDDPNVAGELAFDWVKEFPEVFDRKIDKLSQILKAHASLKDKGGFDVVIGNPPYVSNWTLSNHNREMVKVLERKYNEWLVGHWDIFLCFIGRSIELLHENGYHSFILPTSFLKEKHSKSTRELLLSKYKIEEIVDFGEKVVFENVARQTLIYILNKKFSENHKIKIKNKIEDSGIKIKQSFFYNLKNSSIKTNVEPLSIKIYNKTHLNSILLGQLVCINTGVVAHSREGSEKKFTKDSVIFKNNKKGFKKYIIGTNIGRYHALFNGDYIDYENNITHFHRSKYQLLFESPKIIVRRISGSNNSLIAYYDEEKFFSNDNLMHLVSWNDEILKFQKPENKWEILKGNKFDLKFIVSILCSKLITYFFSNFLSTDTLQGSYSSIYPEDLRVIPIKNINTKSQKPFTQKADTMLIKNKELQGITTKFNKLLKSDFQIEKIPKKLEEWYQFSWDEFLNELKKKKIELSLKQKSEWMDYFESEKQKAIAIKEIINKTDKEIDNMVYELYGLTDEEIKIVEGER
ncbi:MAG: N-6 DNA methylase [Leptospiraceae bacterium]|nr:N-6 DNA methylase [Leptospiraceae bacterium]